ncbi:MULTISPECIES: LysR family substrate-binding domain-containing protein [unclassified Luteococcus]|uniref:LysR family substrate-binding domain-containing protein n=1 Tax=unclassified Luteococcus TaxID=2639923 RepID=UPI00313BFE12
MSQNPSTLTGLRIGHVRGVVLHKWQRTWEERFRHPLQITEVPDAEQLAGLRDGSLDMCFVRLPIDRDGLHAIPLYEEQLVAWVSKEHLFAAADEISQADLAEEETVLTELDAVAIDRVLAGAVLVVPMSVARGASRKDLVYRPITDAETSPVALAWRMDDQNPLLDEFVGVVRGRSANSSRTQQQRAATGHEPAKARPRARKPKPKKVRRGH